MTKINEWREWKGKEEADRILKVAGWRGTKMHNSIEHFLLTREEPQRCMLTTPYWNSIRPFICKIKHTALIEGTVWHPDGFAGSLDHLGYYEDDGGVISLSDWKSAEKAANEEKLYDYKLQVAAYVAAAEFVYSEFNLLIPQARIVVAIPDARCQVVLLQRDELKQLFIHFQARNRYANSSY
jgi:genome maintenance exonuclease 1